jgi:hypothetical protein
MGEHIPCGGAEFFTMTAAANQSQGFLYECHAGIASSGRPIPPKTNQPSGKCPPKAPAVRFRYNRAPKLMQKIHRLTDN